MDLEELVSLSERITKENFPKKEIEVCSIISAKTGKCPENCKYCSQSIHNHADIFCHPLLAVEEVKQAALRAKENGASRFCIVTSGRRASVSDFEKILEMIAYMEEKTTYMSKEEFLAIIGTILKVYSLQKDIPMIDFVIDLMAGVMSVEHNHYCLLDEDDED